MQSPKQNKVPKVIKHIQIWPQKELEPLGIYPGNLRGMQADKQASYTNNTTENREKTEALNKQRRHRGLDTDVSRETGEDTKTVNGMKSNSKSDMILTK